MTKLYAFRSKDTGQIYSVDEFLDLHNSEVIETDAVRFYPSRSGYQVRIEPTKPCLYCYNSSTESKFCHICGRSLK